MTAKAPILTSLSAASAYGEVEAHEAANLTRDILAAATSAVYERSGKQVETLLGSLEGLSPQAALAALSGASILADRGSVRVKQLEAMQATLPPLQERLDADLAVFRASRDSVTDVLQEAATLALLERRIIHFVALSGGLKRCEFLLQQLLSTERLVEDQLVTLRDATTPIAITRASLEAMSTLSRQMDAMGHEIDSFCEGVISADSARLWKRNSPVSPKPAGSLFRRRRDPS